MFSLKKSKTVDAVEVPAALPVTRVVPQNIGKLKARKPILVREVEAARNELAAAKQRWDDHVLGSANGTITRGEASLEAARLRNELFAAESGLAAQEEALALVERELATYESPARKAAVAAQVAQCRRLAAERVAAIEKLEKLISGPMLELLDEYHELRNRMVTAIGCGLGGDFGPMEDAKFISTLLAKHFRGRIDGTTISWVAQAGPDDRPWAEQARILMGRRLEQLDDLA